MNDTSLLPDDFLAEVRERRTNIAALLLFAVVLGGVAFWYTRTNSAWHEIRDRQEQVRQSFASVAEQIRDMQEQETTRREMLDKAQLALSLVDPVPRSILLAELVDRLPERVSLVDLELRSQPIKRPAAKPAETLATNGSTVWRQCAPCKQLSSLSCTSCDTSAASSRACNSS